MKQMNILNYIPLKNKVYYPIHKVICHLLLYISNATQSIILSHIYHILYIIILTCKRMEYVWINSLKYMHQLIWSYLLCLRIRSLFWIQPRLVLSSHSPDRLSHHIVRTTSTYHSMIFLSNSRLVKLHHTYVICSFPSCLFWRQIQLNRIVSKLITLSWSKITIIPFCYPCFSHFLNNLKTTSQSHHSIPKNKLSNLKRRSNKKFTLTISRFHKFNKITNLYNSLRSLHKIINCNKLPSRDLKLTFHKFGKLIISHYSRLCRILSNYSIRCLIICCYLHSHQFKSKIKLTTFLLFCYVKIY